MLFLFLLTISGNAYSKEYQKLPGKIQVAFVVKILELNKTLFDSKKDIRIHVVNDILLYQEFQKMIGMTIKGKVIKEVTATEDDILPSYIPSVIYIGDTRNLKEILAFTQKNKVLSITGNPDLIKQNVTISAVMQLGSPKVLFEPGSSEKEDMEWDPKIMKISTVIK